MSKNKTKNSSVNNSNVINEKLLSDIEKQRLNAVNIAHEQRYKSSENKKTVLNNIVKKLLCDNYNGFINGSVKTYGLSEIELLNSVESDDDNKKSLIAIFDTNAVAEHYINGEVNRLSLISTKLYDIVANNGDNYFKTLSKTQYSSKRKSYNYFFKPIVVTTKK